jgi:hypothetical protein
MEMIPCGSMDGRMCAVVASGERVGIGSVDVECDERVDPLGRETLIGVDGVVSDGVVYDGGMKWVELPESKM